MPNIGKRKILIADVSEESRAALRKILEDEYIIAETADVDSCIDILRGDKSIDLVLLDLEMPGACGYEILRKIQEDPDISHKYVIVTASANQYDAEVKSFKAGAVDYIEKPYNAEIVKSRVNNVIRRVILESEMLEYKLWYAKTHDRLTQLYKRDMFFMEARKFIDRAPDKRYIIVLFDIKNFKVVNELFGSKTGDDILIFIAENMRRLIGNKGIFGRWGADKYVLCISKKDLNVHTFLADVDQALKESGILDYNIKIFAGVYDATDNAMPVEKMCDRAHLAVKAAKNDYVGRVARYNTQMRQKIIEEENIISEMESALHEHQFKVCYQPIYSSENGLPISAEALVRWVHPLKGIVPPDKFITIFENNKFITQLDTYVLEEVCKFQRNRLKCGKPVIPISVNFSRIDCYRPMICENMLSIVNGYGLKPEHIKIEITETAYTIDKEQIISATDKFRSSGFKILMDDFGSGYSSLNILNDVNIDTLKIDKKLIDDISSSQKGRAILTSVVNMAKMIGIDVVAEGVETRYQLDFLNNIGCDTIQGYYYSRPLFAEDFEKAIDLGYR